MCIPNGLCQEVHEINISSIRCGLSSTEDTVIGTFHEGLLKLNGMLDARILKCSRGEQLELGVELSNSVLHEQPEEVETKDKILLWRWRKTVPGIDIVGFELEEISLKSILILSFNAQNNSVLVNVPYKVLPN